MTAPTTTAAPAPSTAAGGSKGKPTGKAAQAPALIRPFIVGSRKVDKQDYNVQQALTSASQHLPTYQVSPNGFVSRLSIWVNAPVSTNSTNNVAYAAEGPFNALLSIQLSDVNNKPIFGPMTGWDAYIANKYGGYYHGKDARQSKAFSAVTGTGATGGTFGYIIDIPVQIVNRDAFGSLVNKSSTSTFTVDMYLNASTAIYTQVPSALPTVTVKVQLWGWSDPTQSDKLGNQVAQNPPASNTIQYWSKQNYVINAGAFDFRLQGIDNYVRMLIPYLVDGSGSRSQGESDWPDPLTYTYETLQTMVRQKVIWQDDLYKKYGFSGANESAGAFDNAVYPIVYNDDFALTPGGETRLSYLPVSSNTNLELSGVMGGSGAHTLYVLVNKIVPYGSPLAMSGR